VADKPNEQSVGESLGVVVFLGAEITHYLLEFQNVC
jgi:hypothetical protein